MTNKMIILVGVSGSGKSSFAKSLCKENHSFLRINRDDIRRVLVGDLTDYYTRKDLHAIENEITFLEFEFFLKTRSLGKNVVIDNTNLSKKYIDRWVEIAKGFGYEVELKFFDVELREAQHRIYERDFYYTEDNLDCVKYIEKQFEQYRQIKKEYESKNTI